MTLLAPWALWFFAVAGGVVALYLLKIKRRTAPVPALEFWLALAGKTRVHSLFDRLKRLLSLLLWLVIVTCLVLALTNPILALGRITPRAIAIVIDNSASMQAVEDVKAGTTRLDHAKEALKRISGGRPVADEWLVIEAARVPRVVQSWTFETNAVRRAGEALRPFHGAGDLAESVHLAAQLVAGKRDPAIVVISDGAAGSLATLAAADSRIISWPIGATRDNAGITRLAVRADRQNGNYQVLIGVFNAGEEALETPLTIEIDGKSQSVEIVSAPAGAAWEKTITIEAPNGGVLRASLDRPDALAVDNEAYAILEPIRPAVVWLVSAKETAFFFEQALGSMAPLVWSEESLTLLPDEYERAAASAAKPDSTIKRPDLVIFHGWTPPAPTALPTTGRFVFINTCPTEFGIAQGEPIGSPQIRMNPRPHPLTRHVSLQGSRVGHADRLTLKPAAEVFAQTEDGDPLIFLINQPERRAVCIAFDVVNSDLPFRNAFPLLLRNAVSFLHEDAPSRLRPTYTLGEPIHPLRPLPAAIAEATLRVQRTGNAASQVAVQDARKMQDVKLPVKDGLFSYTDTERPGAVRLDVPLDGRDEVSFAAITLGDPLESEIAPTAPADYGAAKLGLSRRLFWGLGGMPWVALAGVVLVGVALEWLTFHFRWTE